MDANTEVVTGSRVDSTLILANIGELVAAIFMKTAGVNASASIAGESLTREMVARSAMSQAAHILRTQV